MLASGDRRTVETNCAGVSEGRVDGLREARSRTRSTRSAAKAATASSPTSSAAAAPSRPPTISPPAAPRADHGVVLQRLPRHGPAPGRASRPCTRPSTRSAPAPAARATSPAPRTITSSSRPSSPTCTARKRRCCSPRPTSPTTPRCRRCVKLLPGCVIFSDEKNHASMIDGIRHGGGAEAHLPPQRPRRPRGQAARRCRATTPKIIAFESVYSMDGHIAPIARDLRSRREVRRADLPRRGARGRHVRPARRRHRRARRRHGPRRHHQRHAGQGLRRHGRLHRRQPRPAATPSAPMRRASSSRPRWRRRSPPARWPASAT